MYTFVLKVTDGSGQSSSAKVHVFVKPPTNTPPVAKAGTNSVRTTDFEFLNNISIIFLTFRPLIYPKTGPS